LQALKAGLAAATRAACGRADPAIHPARDPTLVKAAYNVAFAQRARLQLDPDRLVEA
jgi:hypothetical protein